MTALYTLDVRELLQVFEQARVTPVDAVVACLGRLEAVDTSLNTSVLLLPDTALESAERSAARWRVGAQRPLEGVPFGVKDNIDVAGAVTSAGSRARQVRAGRDAEVVRRLMASGAIPVAKLQTTAFAFGDPHSGDFGTTRNPWDTTRSAGASSSGPAAAVAARAVPFAVGTDSAGSVRIPASHCGVCAIKPTLGAVSRTGVLPGTWSLDHVGLLARRAADLRTVLACAVGPDSADPMARGHVRVAGAPRSGRTLDGLRLGVLRGRFTELSSTATLQAFQDAVELFSSWASVSELELPYADDLDAVAFPLAAVEMAASLDAVAPGAVPPDSPLAAFLAYGRSVPAVDYVLAQGLRGPVAREVRRQTERFDVLLSPTVQCVAPPMDGLLATTGQGDIPWFDVAPRNTLPFNVLGQPTVTVPMGTGEHGLPLGLQIAGRPGADGLVLAVAEAFQAASDHTRSPSW